MKIVFVFVITSLLTNPLFAKGADSLLIQLTKEIDRKHVYDLEKERELQNIKQMLNVKHLLPEQEYDINFQLAKKYRKYNIDSAIYYTSENLSIAESLNAFELKVETKLYMSLLYSVAGMYIESNNILENIIRNALPQKFLPLYFETCYYLYEHYAQNCDSDIYWQKHDLYRDSLLMALDKNTLFYEIVYIGKLIAIEEYGDPDAVSTRLDTAEKRLTAIFSRLYETHADYAHVAYILSNVYKMKGDVVQQKKYLILSAVADIKNSTKENASMQSLAMLYYQTGHIDLAYKFMQSTIEDMAFCGVRFRSTEVSAVSAIINTAYLEKEVKRKHDLQVFLWLISVLSGFLIVAVLYVYKQMKKLSSIRKDLSATNCKLTELNRQMNLTNDKLSESDHIKEEYIALFFDLCSDYIDKWENYRKTLNKKAVANQRDELFQMLKSTTLVDDERKKLYETFDTIFLKLYPTFIKELNALLVREKQIILKPGELLNTELRIFALIRLGITDSTQIANFLHYSVSTIYNYRSIARNNAVVSHDDFEEMVMKIGIIQEKEQAAH
jgi:hypothetical protein